MDSHEWFHRIGPIYTRFISDLSRFILDLYPIYPLAQVRPGGSSVSSINLRSDSAKLAYYLLIAYLILFMTDKKEKKKTTEKKEKQKKVKAV